MRRVTIDHATTRLHAEEHVISAGERHVELYLFLLGAALRLDPVHLVLIRHKALEVDDVGVVAVMGNAERLTLYQVG